MARNSDVAWERFGSEDPYFGVLTADRFRGSDLDDATRDEFFATGEQHVEDVLATIRRAIDPAFTPTRALDFGCGVGRVLIPLATRCREVVGVDVSESMLTEAAKNARGRGLTNVELVGSDDDLTGVAGRFDLVHSFIVFQHMPVRAGMRVFTAMLGLLEPSGVGALHFTYARDASPLRGLASKAATVPSVRSLANLARGRPLLAPVMQMNNYNLGRVVAMLQRAGCAEIHAELTDHYGRMGAFIYFKR